MVKVLVVSSNTDVLAGKPNGTYAPELAHAVEVLEENGIEWEVVSPNGGKIPVYGEDADDVTKKVCAGEEFVKKVSNTGTLSDVDVSKYEAVYYPGGYGLLFDLCDSEVSQKVAASFYEAGKPVSAVCHGPAALAKVKLSDGSGLIDGKNVTGFTREEEVAYGTINDIPFVLEESMMENGGIYQKKKTWQELVITDGLLITGQNPGSAGGVGKAIVAAIKK